MKKEWISADENRYVLHVDRVEQASLMMYPATLSQRAEVRVAGQPFEINRTGFWKSNIDITDAHGNVALRVRSEKWYANTWMVDFGTEHYTLVLRNNPMAEWALLDGSRLVLAYGLTTDNGRPTPRISGEATNQLLLDALMWYLFAPIAHEQVGNDLTFLSLLAQ